MIWSNPVARRHLAGVWINSLGGGVFDIALPLIVLTTTGSLTQMAIVAVAGQLPKAFPGFLIGALVDRKSARRLMLFGYLAQGVVVSMIPILGWCGVESLWVIVTVAYLRGSFDMVARTATFVVIPKMYGKETPAFNAALSTAWTSASIVGPALGGVLVSLISAPTLVLADALSFFVMAGIMATLPVPTVAPEHDGDSFISSLKAGYAHLIRLPGWWNFMVAATSVGLLGAPLMTLAMYDVYAESGKNPGIVGIISAAGGLGLFAGSLVAHKWGVQSPRLTMLRGSTVMASGMLLFFVGAWQSTAAATFIVCAGGIYWTVGRSTILHQNIDEKNLGKASTLVSFVETCIGPLSLFLATWLYADIASWTAFMYMFVMAIISGVAILRSKNVLESRSHEVMV